MYKPREKPMEKLVDPPDEWSVQLGIARLHLWIECPQVLVANGNPLGLSPLPISDRVSPNVREADEQLLKPRSRKGLRGITPFGQRVVRNAAYLIERKGGRFRCVFATATIPNLPIEDMQVLHQNFGHVLELYRLNLRRRLQANGLSGESVSAVEIQEKRYERTGLPVLHVHTVFVGKTVSGKWAISPEAHDDAWSRALSCVLAGPIPKLTSACNLQRVRRSSEGYLGKYMSKGSKVIANVMNDGFIEWVPKHWWACSRSLRREIDRETRNVSDVADWLNDVADIEGADVWLWHRDVLLEMDDGRSISIARYGRLNQRESAKLHQYFKNNSS